MSDRSEDDRLTRTLGLPGASRGTCNPSIKQVGLGLNSRKSRHRLPTAKNVTESEQQQLDVPKLVLEAHERIKDYLTPTPLEFSRFSSDLVDGEVWLTPDLDVFKKIIG